tara:strand:+ start:17932 stop:18567 length:636 start_codon:yes stop_codon:yes gene_type:complete
MTLDVVNEQNKKVDSLDLSDDVFGGRVNQGLIWESVINQNASERRGTHATKTRGLVRGAGSKPWRQKGTGRARVGEVRNPLWRKGGTVFGPQPRSYAYSLPKKVVLSALRASLTQKFNEGVVTVVDRFSVFSNGQENPSTKVAAELLEKLNVKGRAVLVDVKTDLNLTLSLRNIPKVSLVASNQLTARDVAGASCLVMTKASVEHLEKVLM